MAATLDQDEAIHSRRSDFPKAIHGVCEYIVNVGIRQGARTHLQTVVKGGIENIDHRTGINVGAKKARPNPLLEIGDRHSSSRHCPSFAKFLGKPRVKLRFSEESTHEGPIFSAEKLCHRTHLHSDAFGVILCGQEEGAGIDASDERVHDDCGLVAPSAIDCHAPDFCLFGNVIHADRLEAAFQHKVYRCLQDSVMNTHASRASARGLDLVLFASRFHQSPNAKEKS